MQYFSKNEEIIIVSIKCTLLCFQPIFWPYYHHDAVPLTYEQQPLHEGGVSEASICPTMFVTWKYDLYLEYKINEHKQISHGIFQFAIVKL